MAPTLNISYDWTSKPLKICEKTELILNYWLTPNMYETV